MTSDEPRQPVTKAAVLRRAVRLHERDCPGDQEYQYLSANHQHVHETEALRALLAKP